MSTFEYNDLFKNAQLYGNYHVFVFDIVKSKEMDSSERLKAQEKTENLILHIYNHIEKIEKETDSKILLSEEGINSYKSKDILTGFGMKTEPFVLGDAFGFTIYRNTLSNDEIKFIFNYYYKELKIDFNFHIADGFYETNNYGEGCIKYFRGYCIDVLCNLHKKQYSKILK